MLVKAQRISRMKDNVTWCRPSEGYDADNAIEIELGDYQEIDTVQGELPESDEKWPKGADRKSVVQGKSVDLGGRRIIKKKRKNEWAEIGRANA